MALTAQGRASAMVVGLVPVALAGAMSIFNPNYLKPLIETDMGRMFVLGAIILELIGILIIRRIVDIKP